jgi:hypothetical protein
VADTAAGLLFYGKHWKKRESYGYSHGRRHDLFQSKVRGLRLRCQNGWPAIGGTIPEHRHRILIEMRKNSFFSICRPLRIKRIWLRVLVAPFAPSHLSPEPRFTRFDSFIVSPICSPIFV